MVILNDDGDDNGNDDDHDDHAQNVNCFYPQVDFNPFTLGVYL